jgi:hypothetical protein
MFTTCDAFLNDLHDLGSNPVFSILILITPTYRLSLYVDTALLLLRSNTHHLEVSIGEQNVASQKD